MSTHHMSQNCKIGESPNVLFTFTGISEDDQNKKYYAIMLSCQKNHLENPDVITMKQMQSIANDVLNVDDVDVIAHSIPLGHQTTGDSATELRQKKMASNCAPHYNLNEVTAYNKFECRYLGEAFVDGVRVHNPFKTWSGTLPSCDDTIEISDDVMSDIRKLAYEAAGGDESKMDVNQFSCSVQSLPFH